MLLFHASMQQAYMTTILFEEDIIIFFASVSHYRTARKKIYITLLLSHLSEHHKHRMEEQNVISVSIPSQFLY